VDESSLAPDRSEKPLRTIVAEVFREYWNAVTVAEPFSRSERIETMKAIKLKFFANAAEAGEDEESWQVTFKKSRDPRVIEAIVKEIDQ
jgi:hypothetical protein